MVYAEGKREGTFRPLSTSLRAQLNVFNNEAQMQMICFRYYYQIICEVGFFFFDHSNLGERVCVWVHCALLQWAVFYFVLLCFFLKVWPAVLLFQASWFSHVSTFWALLSMSVCLQAQVKLGDAKLAFHFIHKDMTNQAEISFSTIVGDICWKGNV